MILRVYQVGDGEFGSPASVCYNADGTITGIMFNDTNGNGKLDKGETPLNWTCYIHVDNDGKFDNQDIRIYTNKHIDFGSRFIG